MKCKFCTAEIPDGSKFCDYCGKSLIEDRSMEVPRQPVQQYVNSNNFQGGAQPNYQYNTEDELLDAFIGPNVAAIKQGGFSLPGFFIPFEYLLYRKMWLYAVLLLVISVISGIFLSSISLLIAIAIRVIMGIYINKWYVDHAKEEVNKIREEHITRSMEELKAMCAKKGGTSILAAVLPTIILICLSIMISVISYVLISIYGRVESNHSMPDYDYSVPNYNFDNGSYYNY